MPWIAIIFYHQHEDDKEVERALDILTVVCLNFPKDTQDVVIKNARNILSK